MSDREAPAVAGTGWVAAALRCGVGGRTDASDTLLIRCGIKYHIYISCVSIVSHDTMYRRIFKNFQNASHCDRCVCNVRP
jgi:hypothetical protein